MKNSCDFGTFLSSLALDFDVIGLSETWLKHEDDVISHMSGYFQVHNCRQQKVGGGVSLLLRDHLKFIVLDQFSMVTELFESIHWTGNQW